MRLRHVGLAGLVMCLTAGLQAADLNVGDKAPALAVSKFVKGEPVKEFQEGKIYVVEFWATWCGPCKVSIPHLTELQKKHEDVTFIGVSIWENDQEEVEPFVKDMGDKMDYTVAMDEVKGDDPSNGEMAKSWMNAAGQNGIPSAFIVNKEGKIAWIGHPMAMDKPLEEIVAGTFDLEAAAKEQKALAAAQEKMTELSGQLVRLIQTLKYNEAIDLLDKAIEEDPVLEKPLAMTRFNLLIRSGDLEGLVDYANKLVDDVLSDDAMALNNVAWLMIDPERPGKPSKAETEVALKAAQRSNELSEGKDGNTLDTLALAYFLSGDAQKAYEHQKKALELLPEADDAMKERLEQYKQAAEKGAN